MYKYAQIIDNKVHWIMEHQANLQELYKKYFSSNMVFVDITAIKPQPKEGWIYDGYNFTDPNTPTTLITKAIDRLDATYNPQFTNLAIAQSTALITGDTALLADIKDTYTNLLAEYIQKRGEIENGN